MNKPDRKIVFDDGTEYCGFGFGSSAERITEIVFNTSMVGYQEILSDPSYTYQTVVLTYPIIGNYGMAEDDYETAMPTIGGLVVREYTPMPSNFRASRTLEEVMKEFDVPGLYGVDTREIARSIRSKGTRKVLITSIGTPTAEAVAKIKAYDIPTNAVSRVSTKKARTVGLDDAKYKVVAIDCGMKENIVRSLCRYGCRVTVVPFNTRADEILKMKPDGVFISNGPGNPEDALPVIRTISALKGKIPMFGICLGHQMIGLAYGAKTYKLKFGHRGGNHPVKNLSTGKIEITSQNHSYAVDAASIAGTPIKVTHMNILDNTVEGMSIEQDKVFSVQYHPESAPGPQDSAYLFERFTKLMEDNKKNA